METRICKRCEVEKPISEYRQVKDRPHLWERTCKKCHNKRSNRENPNRAANLARYRQTDKYKQANRRGVVAKYGLTIEEYDAMVAAAGGVCEICKQPETKLFRGKTRALSVDHCHTSLSVRGILCDDCNTTLGKMGESVERLQAMIDYIKERGA